MIVSYHWFAIWVQEKEGVLEEKEGNAQKGTLLRNIIVSSTTYCCMNVEFQASMCFNVLGAIILDWKATPGH